MVIAMIPMGVMQMIANQIIYMIAVRYGLMAAARAVLVVRVMAAALMVGGTPIRIGIADCKHAIAFLDVDTWSVLEHIPQIASIGIRVRGGIDESDRTGGLEQRLALLRNSRRCQ
jgi:hypothetical protein